MPLKIKLPKIKLPKIKLPKKKLPKKKLPKKKALLILLPVALLVALAAAFLLLRGCGKDKGGEASDAAASVSADVPAPEPTPTPEPVTVAGVNINRVDLCAVLPAGAGITDPNVVVGQELPYSPVTTFNSGVHTEIALHYADNTVALSSMAVLCLQAFNIGETPPELVTYTVEADVGKPRDYAYQELAEHVVYQNGSMLVADVTFARARPPRQVMEQYITEHQGKELRRVTGVELRGEDRLADGTFVYKYNWMPEAFDYVTANVSQMLVPLLYAAPHSLEELGYSFVLASNPKTPPRLTTITAQTVSAEVENGHSGLYTASVYGGERLLGGYTVLQPTYAAGGDGPANPSSLALLQGFYRSEVERPDVGIRFLRRDKPRTQNENYYKIFSDGPFSEFSLPSELVESYVVYRDETVVIYDFFDFSKAPSLEEQLKSLADTEGFEQYGIKSSGVNAARRALLDSPGGLGKCIRKE